MEKLISVLVVEDSDAKRSSIESILRREIQGVKIFSALSVRSAIDHIEANTFDLIVADMSLPTFDIETREPGGTPRPFGGIEVFEALDKDGLAVPVLVISSYPELNDGKQTLNLSELSTRLQKEFKEIFIGTVYFDPTYEEWEAKVAKYINDIREKWNGA